MHNSFVMFKQASHLDEISGHSLARRYGELRVPTRDFHYYYMDCSAGTMLRPTPRLDLDRVIRLKCCILFTKCITRTSEWPSPRKWGWRWSFKQNGSNGTQVQLSLRQAKMVCIWNGLFHIIPCNAIMPTRWSPHPRQASMNGATQRTWLHLCVDRWEMPPKINVFLSTEPLSHAAPSRQVLWQQLLFRVHGEMFLRIAHMPWTAPWRTSLEFSQVCQGLQWCKYYWRIFNSQMSQTVHF